MQYLITEHFQLLSDKLETFKGCSSVKEELEESKSFSLNEEEEISEESEPIITTVKKKTSALGFYEDSEY